MGWWSALFAAPKAVEKVAEMGETIVKGAVSGLDKIFFTDEERAEAHAEASKIVLGFWDRIAKENTEQSRARRALAMMSFKAFFALIFMAVLCKALAIPFAAQAVQLNELATFILGCIKLFSFIISAITVIYFGPHQVSKIWTSKKK